MDKVPLSITVDTSVSSFTSAAVFAISLASEYACVAFTHSTMTIQVNPDWSSAELETAWKYAVMVTQGRGIP